MHLTQEQQGASTPGHREGSPPAGNSAHRESFRGAAKGVGVKLSGGGRVASSPRNALPGSGGGERSLGRAPEERSTLLPPRSTASPLHCVPTLRCLTPVDVIPDTRRKGYQRRYFHGGAVLQMVETVLREMPVWGYVL
jgi:hypothetical protein